MDEDSAWRRSLAALSSFFVGDATLVDTLRRVADLADQAVPPSKFVGVTMLVENRPQTAVFTDPESPEIDQAQYRSGNGPCIDAFRTGDLCMLKSTLAPNRWPEFSEACVGHGILSTMSLPLSVAGAPLGAMNFYADHPDAFDATDVDTASLFASQAAIVLANSQAYWDARALGEQLREAIESRAVIEQAKGIIMGALRCDADDAFKHLLNQSQTTNTKLRIVAQDIVNDTARRGRSTNGDA
ncbi:MAG TPA: GAF and ANTAR domain-containing protein [Ilumatobacteraceae bacterium]